MKQILKYLLCLMIGIIIYILVNSKDNFSVGIVSYNVVWGEEGGGVAREQFDSQQEAENFYNNHLDDDTYPNMAIYRVNDNGTQEYIEPSRQPSRTAQEGIPITISIITGTFQVQVPTAYTLQELQEMINLVMMFPPNFDGYRLILNGTGGLVLDEVMDTLSKCSEGIRLIRNHYQGYRQTLSGFTDYEHKTLREGNPGWSTTVTTNIYNMTQRLKRIDAAVNRITEYNTLIEQQLGQYYRLFIQFETYLNKRKDYPPQENYKYGDTHLNEYPEQDRYLVTYDTLQYTPNETNLGRFNRILRLVNPIIITNIESINRNIERYRNSRESIGANSYLESINLSFKNIYRLLDLLLDMIDDMFTLETTLVNVLQYYQIEENGLTLVLRQVCASEGVPPSTD